MQSVPEMLPLLRHPVMACGGGGGVVGGAYDPAGVAHAIRGGDRSAVLAVLDGSGQCHAPRDAAHARLACNGSGDAYAGCGGIVRHHAAEDARQLALGHGDFRIGHGEVLHGGPVQNAEEADGEVGALG